MSGTKTNYTFQRVEKKYLLDNETYRSLREKIDEYMQVDEYGLNTICNVYYDTEDFYLIRTSIEKPVYKEKLRVRSYGVPGANDKTFVEVKKKCKGVVYKRRIELPWQEAKGYLEQGIKPENESQIQREIDYFLQMYKPVPKMYIAYDRIAMFGKEDESIRVTFDFNIRTRGYELDLSKGDHGVLLLDPGQVLMEIKVGGAYPLWLSKILNEEKVYPTSFSKYGNIYKKHILQNKEGEEQHVI